MTSTRKRNEGELKQNRRGKKPEQRQRGEFRGHTLDIRGTTHLATPDVVNSTTLGRGAILIKD